MDKIEKLFRRLTGKERKIIRQAVADLIAGKNPDTKKIESSIYFRARAGNFRIIFHHINNRIIIDDIRKRDENTYKNL